MPEKELSIEHVSETQQRRRFAPVATLAASLLATFGANYLIGHGDIPVIHHDGYTTTSDPVVTSSSTPHVLVLEEAPGGPTTPVAEPKTETDVELSARVGWAELFAADAAAHETNLASVNKTADRVAELLLEGKKDIVVTLVGHTSAEDNLEGDTGAQTAGVQTVSQENQDLGATRALVYGGALLDTLAARGFEPKDGFSIAIGPTKEQQLSDIELAAGQELAARFGFADFRTMVQAWNRTPDEVPTEVTDFFVKDLRFPDNRVVAPSIRYTTIPNAYPDEEPEAVCEYTVTEVSNVETLHIPPFEEYYLIPIPIPLWRKRRERNQEDPAEGTPEPIEPVTEETSEPEVPEDGSTTPPETAGGKPEPEPDEDGPGGGRGGLGSGGGNGQKIRPLKHKRLREESTADRLARYQRYDRWSKRGTRGLLVAALLLAGYVEYKSDIDWDTCFIDVTKDGDTFVPDIDFHWDCHWPETESDDPAPTVPPTVPIDPCDTADRVRVTTIREERRDGQITDRTTSVRSEKR